MASGWTSLERPSTRCADCEARLADRATQGDPAYATLRIEAGQLVREDLCPACFDARKPRPATFWKRRVRGGDAEPEKAKSPKRRQTERLLELFDTLAASLEPDKQATEPAVTQVATTDPEVAESLEAGPAALGPVLAEPKGGEGAPGVDKLRYLLALALVRARRLELVDLAREGGADCLVVKRSGEAEVVNVSAPPIPEAELELLLQDLNQKLDA